jgi:protein phosphatase
MFNNNEQYSDEESDFQERYGDLSLFYDSSSLTRAHNNICEATTSIGLRKEQEDRLVMCPRLGRDDISCFGVFDGTVGDHASDFVQKNFVPELLKIKEFQELIENNMTDQYEINTLLNKARQIMYNTFLTVDKKLLQMCHEQSYNYASSTGVVVFLVGNILTVSHVGDSRACIASVSNNGTMNCEMLTLSHKPNQPSEMYRIQQCGGSVVYLHYDKPYIRGGDFLLKQSRGEKAKQLNYSRAFGGKDLKMFGLIADPDVSHFNITSEDKLILLASDGLWDCMSAHEACDIALTSYQNGRSATQDIIQRAVSVNMPRYQVRDNITVIAIFLNADGITNVCSSTNKSAFNSVATKHLSSSNGKLYTASPIAVTDEL